MPKQAYGLAAIVSAAADNTTLHSIPEPPHRDDFESDEDYRRAYEKWYWETVSWKASRKSNPVTVTPQRRERE